MIIASIDIQNGKAVQLKRGKELVLERDNLAELAQEFDKYGEVAVIDLDAAMGKSSNIEQIKPLLRIAECRVGGGIRTADDARRLVSLGAKKVIIGSAAFRKDGEFAVNVPLLESISKAIGRERVIVAVDANNSEIFVDGWKTPTGLDLITAAKTIEPYVGELLFTCIEREGMMQGIDLEPVKHLREAVSCLITAAGGVSSMEEIETLASLGCDVQLGMALYTGKISLAQAFIRSLNWKKGALGDSSMLPIIAQSSDGQVLMTGFTDETALAQTFKSGNLCFFSRTRSKIWMKGETSGNILKVLRLRADCDRDAILAIVSPHGPVCHTGAWSCFCTDRRYTLEYLHKVITERFKNPVPGSYTATLDDKLVREKIMEEADELCTAMSHDEIVWEAADLFYFATALIAKSNINISDVLDELDRRHKK